MFRTLTAGLVLCFALGGCSTMASMTGGGEPRHLFGPYSGTQRNIDIMFVYSGCKNFPIFGYFDFAFSLVLDTVCLPVSIPVWFFRDKNPKPRTDLDVEEQ